MNNFNWVALSSIAACITAIVALFSILITYRYDKKTYRANFEIKSKLEFIDPIKKLVPDYIAASNDALYLYIKAWSDINDTNQLKKGNLPDNVIIGRTSLDDFDTQLTNAKKIYFELETYLTLYGCNSLLKDTQEVWNVLRQDNLNKIRTTATNQRISDQEKEVSDEFAETKNKLNKDFIDWYKSEFNKLIKY